MLKTTMGGVLFIALISGASAHDALLTGALDRNAVPVSALRGVIQTHSVIKGGSDADDEDETIDVQKSPKRAMPSYADLKKVISADAHVVSEAGGRTVYAFTTQTILDRNSNSGHIKLDVGKGDPEELFNGRAEVILDPDGRPFVSHVDLRLAKTLGNLVARIKQIDLSYSFLPVSTEGAMVTTGFTADVDVRALLFVHRKAHYEESFAMTGPGP